jgi:hypothetical protein
MTFSLAQQWFGIVCIVGLLSLHHLQSLADVTMVTTACNLLWGKKDLKALLALGIKDLWNCLVDFHEIWYGGDAIQGDLNVIILNPKLQQF